MFHENKTARTILGNKGTGPQTDIWQTDHYGHQHDKDYANSLQHTWDFTLV